MEEAHVSAAAMAKRFGISTAAVYQWWKTGRIEKERLPIFARMVNKSVDELLTDAGGPIDVQPTRTMEVGNVLLPLDAIAVAKAWMVLPENERNEFRRQIESAAERYRDYHPPPSPKKRRPVKKRPGKKNGGGQ